MQHYRITVANVVTKLFTKHGQWLCDDARWLHYLMGHGARFALAG